MHSPQPRSSSGNKSSPESLRRIAEAIDLKDVPETAPGLTLVPVAPGRFHANWHLETAIIKEGCRIFGLQPEETRLVLRAYEFSEDERIYQAAQSWEDFPITGLVNRGYFNLEAESPFIGGALGLLNSHGHFRPLLRAESISLPVAPSIAKEPIAIDDEAGEHQFFPEVFDENSILARLPVLEGLPEELLSLPVTLSASPELKPYFEEVLDEPTIHLAAVSGKISDPQYYVSQILPAQAASQIPPASISSAPDKPEQLSDQKQPSSHKPSPPGSSERLASQSSEVWNNMAPIYLRAELVFNGIVAPGFKVRLNGVQLGLLPGRQFKIVRKINQFVDIWPFFSTIDDQLEQISLSSGFKIKNNEEQVIINVSICIEGRINDRSYLKHMPKSVKIDSEGRFTLDRQLSDGDALLPGLLVEADA